MTDLGSILRDITGALDGLGASAAVVGGIAVSARTEPRFTRDVDLAVAATGDEQAEALVAALAVQGWRPAAISEHDAAGRLATVRLVGKGSSDDGRVVDLLFASSGIETEIVRAADLLEVLPGVRAAVARTGHLIALKLLARAHDRPQDDVDLDALMRTATADDLELARGAVELIVSRGYGRGRNLADDLERIIAT